MSSNWISQPGWISANSIDAWNPAISPFLEPFSSASRSSSVKSMGSSSGSWDSFSYESPDSSATFSPLDSTNGSWESREMVPPKLPSLDFASLETNENAWEPQVSDLSPHDSPYSQDSPNSLKRNSDIEAELNKQNLYKTEMCRSWVENGLCRYGSKCQFAHGHHEVRPVLRHPKYKTEICKTFHSTGTCPYGKRCRFIHHPSENPNIKFPTSTAKKHSFDSLPPNLAQEDPELEAEITQRLAELKLSLLAPDPVFNPAHLESVETEPKQRTQKKGSRLPFFQKLRKQK